MGQIPLSKLTRTDVEAWIADRLAAGLAPYTVWRLHAILRAGLNRAVKADPPILQRNPASGVDPIQYEVSEVDPLSAAQARRVLEATSETTDHALYAVTLGLGLREGEVLGLRWADGVNDPGIDLDRGEIRVYQQLQFGKLVPLKRSWGRRVLPLSPWLVAVLERHATLFETSRSLAGQKWREHELVFPSALGTPRSAGNLWLSWKRLQKRLGLGSHTFHDLRHTFATLALHAGVPLWKVSKMLGHRDITITLKIYGHLTPEGREDVAERMEGVLGPVRTQQTAVKLRSALLRENAEGADFQLETSPLGLPFGM